MNKVELRHYKAAYELACKLHDHGDWHPDFLDQELVQLEFAGLKQSTARDLITGIRCMVEGRVYRRGISLAATDSFLTWLLRDYGPDIFRNALIALELHIPYNSKSKSAEDLPGQRKLLEKHRALLDRFPDVFLMPDEQEAAESKTYHEGKIVQVLVNAYERDPAARLECLRIYGTTCVVCEVDMGITYGDIGRGFIHVHHLQPLASQGSQRTTDPEQDLRPVCPNCHAMLHREKRPLSIENLKDRMRRARDANLV